jgi:hypothetical protein
MNVSIRPKEGAVSRWRQSSLWAAALAIAALPAKNYASTRYSGLDEIDRGNVKSSRGAFAFSLHVAHGQKSAPIGGDGTLYVFPLLR